MLSYAKMRTTNKVRLQALFARIGAWALIAGLLYLLRSFFLLIFLTFVFGFIQARGVETLAPYIKNRTGRGWIVGIGFLGVFVALGLFLAPSLKTQTKIFVSQSSSYVAALDKEVYAFAESYPAASEAIYQLGPEGQSPTLSLAQQLFGLKNDDDGRPEDVGSILAKLVHLSGKVFGVASAFLLSLLFSFLIVLDLPNLKRSVQGLENTSLRFIYREVIPSIKDLSRVLGKALEAQLLIAVINSLLTAIGLWILGLGSYIAFLGTIVFLFSFVPVAGVFISSIPICLIALQSAGPRTMLLAIAMITLIHLIEAYILNPRIYGLHMRVNPVIVLGILTIAGKLFYFWGLVLGVPVCTWFFTHAIRKSFQPTVSEPELAA